MLEAEGCQSSGQLHIKRIQDSCRLINGGSCKGSRIDIQEFRKAVVAFECQSTCGSLRQRHVSGMVATGTVEEPAESRTYERIWTHLKRRGTDAHRRCRWHVRRSLRDADCLSRRTNA